MHFAFGLHEHKLLSPSRMNASRLPGNVGSVGGRFYWLEASPKGPSLERFSTLFKKKKKKKIHVHVFYWW